MSFAGGGSRGPQELILASIPRCLVFEVNKVNQINCVYLCSQFETYLGDVMIARIRNFCLSATLFGGAAYAYMYYLTSRNLAEYKAIQQAGTLKDASRLTNDSFGISWGFQADDIVMNKIDSGDFLFIKYDCSECLSVPDYLRCLSVTVFKLDEEFDSVGYAYRNEEGLNVLYNQFGETQVAPYGHLVGLPYLRELMVQKNTHHGLGIHTKLKKMLQDENGSIKTFERIRESPVHLANRANSILFEENFGLIIDLRELLRTEQQIHVRTETNRTLRSL